MRSIRGANVVVTGGAGFLGSHLVDYLIEERDCDVLVLDNLCAGHRDFVHPKARFEWCDIAGSERRIYELIKGHRAEYVFNYAALPFVPDSYARPLEVFAVNAIGAMRVVNAAQEAVVKAILQVSSAELYGEVGQKAVMAIKGEVTSESYAAALADTWKIDENAEVHPHSSYGAAKVAVDYFVQVRWREAQTPCIALRQFNCLGVRDIFHDYIVPTVVRQLHCKRLASDCTKHSGTVDLGNNSVRDFMWAGDAVRMAVELLEKGEFGGVYNLGSQESIYIYDLAKLIGKIMGFSDVTIREDAARKRAWELWSLRSCNDKIHSAISYRPTKVLEEAVRITVDDLVARYERGEWR